MWKPTQTHALCKEFSLKPHVCVSLGTDYRSQLHYLMGKIKLELVIFNAEISKSVEINFKIM